MDGNTYFDIATPERAGGKAGVACRKNDISHMVSAASSGKLKLPMVPRVVTNLILQLKSPDVSVNDLAAELERDPVLAARVLRMANSPFFCGYRSVSSIAEAVAVIGTDALRTLVISCGITGLFTDVPNVNLAQFWADATNAALAAREIARLAHADLNAAFLCGLLHRTGHLILCLSYPEATAPFARAPSPCPPEWLEQLERQQFQTTHRAVGAAWFDSLGLPLEVVAGVRDYLDPIGSTTPPCAAMLRLATQLNMAIARGANEDDARDSLDADGLRVLQLESAVAGERFSSMYGKLSQGA